MKIGYDPYSPLRHLANAWQEFEFWAEASIPSVVKALFLLLGLGAVVIVIILAIWVYRLRRPYRAEQRTLKKTSKS